MSLAASANPPRIAVKLKRKKPSNEHDGPLLVRFPHGPPAQLTKPELAGDLTFTLHANGEERKAFQRILLGKTEAVTYQAPNFGSAQSFKSNPAQNAIGVFDAAKSKLKIVPCSHVYRMAQYVEALEHVVDAAEAAQETFSTQQRVLADTFGSRKRQKQLQSRAANQVTVQESTSQVLTHAISSIVPNTAVSEDTIMEQAREKALPPFNADAENVRDIYPFTNLLPAHLHAGIGAVVKRWRGLLKKGSSALSKDFKAENSASTITPYEFIRAKLKSIAERGYEERDADMLRQLVYMQLLLDFRSGGKNKRKVVQMWDGPSEKDGAAAAASAASSSSASLRNAGVGDDVKEYLLSTFTAIGTDGRSNFDDVCLNRLLCYVCIMSVICSNFTLDADAVANMSVDLRTMVTEMLKFYKEAGCTVSKVRIHLSAPLKLPSLNKKIERK